MPNDFVHAFDVPTSALDANGHANNVEFVRWMQDAGVAHSDSVGCTAATRAAGATWVARSHHIEYRRPVFAGDRIHIRTWVEPARRSFSMRKYEFARPADGALVAKGETDWVFVDVQTGRPRSIPEWIQAMFVAAPNDP